MFGLKTTFRLLIIAIVFIVGIPAGGSTNDLRLQTQQLSGGKSANYIRVDLANFDVRVLTPLVSLRGTSPLPSNPERVPQGLYLLDYLNRYQALAVISGGYIDSYSPPTALGLVKSNGILITPPHNSWLTNGLFCSDAGRAIIQFVGSDVTKMDLRDCVQAGPVLLLNAGQVGPRGGAQYLKLAQSVQEQGFICIDGEGRVVMGVTDKIDLAALVEFLNQPEIGCKDALRLTGLDTAGLRDADHLVGHDEYLYPDAIGVFRKR